MIGRGVMTVGFPWASRAVTSLTVVLGKIAPEMPSPVPEVISMPYSFSFVRFTSRISTSTITSARCLSTMSTIRSAAATLSGVSLIVKALAPGRGAMRRAPSTMRSRSIVSLRSALERKNVFTTCCSISRRLAGVSGTTCTMRESTTR